MKDITAFMTPWLAPRKGSTTLTCGCAAYTVSDMPTLTTPDAIHVAANSGGTYSILRFDRIRIRDGVSFYTGPAAISCSC